MSKSQVQNLAKQISNKGRFGDTTIRKIKGKPSHVNLLEALIIDRHGKKGENFINKMSGGGTINPETGMKEHFLGTFLAANIVPIIAGLIFGGGMHTLAGGADAWSAMPGYSYSSKGWKGRKGKKYTGPTDFDSLMDLYQGKGTYKGRGGFGDVIKSLRYHRGGYGGKEMKGWEWEDLLGGGLDAMKKFNPMTALSNIMDPLKKQTKATIQGLGETKLKGTRAAASELSKLGIDRGTSMPSIGKGDDIFGLGASMQGEADRLMKFDVDKQMADLAERKVEGQQDIFQNWISSL